MEKIQLTRQLLDGLYLAVQADGRSLYQLAYAAGLTYPTAWRLIYGDTCTPTFQTVALLANTLGLSLDALVAEVDTEEQRM